MDVVERSDLKKVLEEQQLSLTGITDDRKALELGRLMSARRLIYGSFIIQGESAVMNGRLTETETGRIISSFTARGSTLDILALQRNFSVKAQKALGITVKDPRSYIGAWSAEAVKNYYEGLDLLDRGAVQDARKKFEEASRIDPYYLKPYQGIEESYRFLKDFTRMRQQREIAALYDKISRINRRLKETPWRTFAQIAMDPYYQKMRAENSALYEREVFAYYQGETPAVCTWNLQNHLSQLAGFYEEYFNDSERSGRLYHEIVAITEKSRKLFSGDPFFSRDTYQGLLAVHYLEDWPSVKARSEDS